MKNRSTRRQFLTIAGAIASATLLRRSFFNLDNLFAAPSPLFMRRDVGGLSATDSTITSYRSAISSMKALLATNPLSWAYQAAIHGTTASSLETAWATCQHGSNFFWSWHRMYLYWFERIIRRISGDYGWALPYWNYTSVSQRQLPPMFRDPTSELYAANRNPAMNAGTGSIPESFVQYSAGFAFTDYSSARSSIEGTPHGAVHIAVGGGMATFAGAGLDPIFWLHHGNIDRLWNLWLAQGGGRSNPLDDNNWRTRQFTFFDENGTAVQMTGCDILRAAQQLQYTYEGEPAQVNQSCLVLSPEVIQRLRRILARRRFPPPGFVLGPPPRPLPFSIDIREVRPQIRTSLQTQRQTLLLELEGVEAAQPPGVVWEVYVGLPAGTEPSVRSRYYVGNVALFSTGIRSQARDQFMPARFSFNIERAMAAVLQTNQTRAQVTFVPRSIDVDGRSSQPRIASPVRIGGAILVVEEPRQ